MKILYAPNYNIKEETVVAFGKFDGVHKGHIRLIEALKREANKNNRASVVYTFLNHPKTILTNENLLLLTDNNTKIHKMNKLGIDFLIFENFNKEFAQISSEEFVKNILIDKLNAKQVVIGSNSTFGRNAEGNVETLKKLSVKYLFDVIEIPLLKENNKIISSSEIRKELLLKGGLAK